MGDVSGLQVAGGAFGVVSVSALLMILTQRLKDYWPNCSGRAAMAAVDALSALVTALVLYQVGVNWYDPASYIALAMGTLSLGIVARGHYAALFKQSVPGLPPAADETIVNVDTVPTDTMEH